MKLINFFCTQACFLTILGAILIFLGLGPVNIYQPGTLKQDGSGKINIQYNTLDSNLVDTKIIGNYPFTEAEARAYFTSDNTEVEDLKVHHDPEKKVTYVVIDIDFKDVNRLSEARGFSGNKVSWKDSDSGKVFQWIILKNIAQYNLIGEYIYSFAFEGATINSSNGAVKDNTVTWAINTKTVDFTKDVVLMAVIKSENSSSGGSGGCGLFGMEFPITILFGLVLLNAVRKFNNRTI